MKFESNDKKRILSIVIALTISAIIVWILFRSQEVQYIMNKVFAMLSPFLLGTAIAFLINMPLTGIENKVLKNWNPKRSGLKRSVSLLLSLIIFGASIYFIVRLVVPRLVESVIILYNNVPRLLNQLMKYPIVHDQVVNLAMKYQSLNPEQVTERIKDFIIANGAGIFNNIYSGVTTIIQIVVDFVVAFTFAIYLVSSKEKMIRQIKDVVRLLWKKETADKIIFVGSLGYRKFFQYFKGAFLEAIMLGIMCFIGMIIFGFPHAATVSIIIGCGALIPMVGAILTSVFGMIFIMTQSFTKAILFLLFTVVLQQIEGNVTYPRIVGSSIGLPAAWVLFSITIGASLMGIVGMIIFLPLMSLVYDLLHLYKEYKLNGKNIEFHVDKY